MPSATVRHLGNPRSAIQGLAFPASYRPDLPLITPGSAQCCGDELASILTAWASTTYPAANRTIAYPFQLTDYYLVRKVFWANGTTATTDTASVQVYDEPGTTRLLQGSAAIATANVVQEVDVTDTLLGPGRYYMAYCQSGTTATPLALTVGALANLRAAGIVQGQDGAAGAGASTLTFAALASAVAPFCGIANRTQVA